MTTRERRLVGVFIAIAGVLTTYVITMQFVGAGRGQACRDSYMCRGFLLQHVECVDVGTSSYCTTYCKTNADCPQNWRCAEANPTALTIETRSVGRVCIREAR